MVDAAWLVLASRVEAETLADRTAVLSAALQNGDEDSLRKLELPTVGDALDRFAKVLRDERVTREPGDALLEAVLARGRS